MDNRVFAFLLSAVAGAMTAVGSVLALFLRKEHRRLMAFFTAFCAGVMLYGALSEILKKGSDALCTAMNSPLGQAVALGAFMMGMLFLALLKYLLPEEDALGGRMVALSLCLHNFPEGLATFMAALSEPSLAYPMVIAIALHNIPEGVAVSVPLMQSGTSRARAFWVSSLSGLAEPLGAAVGALFLLQGGSEGWMGILFAFSAGLMAYLSLFELFASSHRAQPTVCLFGTLCGMAMMGASLCLFAALA